MRFQVLNAQKISWVFTLIGFLMLAAGAPTIPALSQDDTDELAAAILGLGPDVDPDEAARAAYVAYTSSAQLAVEYEIEDHPLIHNHKVNMGTKPRGLCWHWAEDMEARLKQEGFETLTIHRAIAEHVLSIDHSTAIISAKGDDFDDGLIVDPWRYGGALHWGRVNEDTNYAWRSRSEVLRERREAIVAKF